MRSLFWWSYPSTYTRTPSNPFCSTPRSLFSNTSNICSRFMALEIGREWLQPFAQHDSSHTRVLPQMNIGYIQVTAWAIQKTFYQQRLLNPSDVTLQGGRPGIPRTRDKLALLMTLGRILLGLCQGPWD